MKQLQIVDMFCGGGGESTGITQAAKQYHFDIKLSAINHWKRAIETHTANYPFAEHYEEPVQNLDPTKVVPGGKLDLLWASPECTHHSNARGGRPRSDQSRATAWEICKWAQELFIGRIIIENVPEFTSWGPLDENGKPIAEKKGTVFNSFIKALESLGYKVEWRVLCAADYGVPTTRRRLFIQAAKAGKKSSGRSQPIQKMATLSQSGKLLKILLIGQFLALQSGIGRNLWPLQQCAELNMESRNIGKIRQNHSLLFYAEPAQYALLINRFQQSQPPAHTMH